MQTKGRALFNLLGMNWAEDEEIQVEPWQVENYRSLALETLFEKLGELKISFNKQRFIEYAGSCDAPEELADALWIEGDDPSEHDKIYLIVFELWRRLLPEKQSLSIFCDELDHLIDLYDRGELASDEPLQTALTELARILDESVDRGQPPKEVFKALSEHCAHDLESFIYDLAATQIDQGNNILASELTDNFFAYIEDERWFEFLLARLTFEADEEEAHFMIDRLMEQLQEEPDFELLLEIARFTATKGVKGHFYRAALEARPCLQVEEDFQELLALSCEFLRFFDQDAMHAECTDILKRRASTPPEKELRPSDRDLATYFSFMESVAQ
jgi:hypothetical protein